MKKLGLGLLGLIVVLIAGLLAAPNLIDWTAQKGRITEQVRALTGRDVAIGGDVRLRLLPTPSFSAEQVRLSNQEGGAASPMIELERLDVKVAFLPLLQGEVQVESIVLVKPIIRLEVLADGRRNWDILAPTDKTPEASGQTKPAPDGVAPAEALPGGIRLDSVKISDGTIVYRDRAEGREERLDDLQATIAADSLAGPFAISGAATARGLPIEFQFNLGRLVRDGATPLNARVRLPGPDADMRFGGALSIHAERTSLRGTLKGKGANLAASIATIAGAAAPDVLAKPFEVEGQIATDALQLTLSEVTLRLDDSTIDGEVKLTFGPPFDAQVSLAAQRLDLDRLLSPAQAEGAAPAPAATAGADQVAQPPAPAPEAADAQGFALPANVTGKLDLAIEALVYRGQVIRQVLLGLRLADGRLDVSQALALLPGGSDVSVSGALTTVTDGAAPELEFAGSVEAASDNFRAILEWFGIDASTVPASRLRKVSLSSRVVARRDRVTLSDIDLAFDLSRATGGIAIAVRARPGLGIGLAVDKLNLDAYLPRAKANAPPVATADATADATAAATPTTEAAPSTSESALALPAIFDRFDANLDLRLGDTTIRGVRAKAVRLDATLQQGGLTVREFRVGDVAGGRLRLSGAIAGLTLAPTVDAAFEASLPEPGRLARALGHDPAPLAPLGPIQLAGTVSGDPTRLALVAGVDVLGGRIEADGTLESAGSAPAFDIALTVTHPDLAKLLGALAPETKLDPAFGGLALSTRLNGTPARFAARDIAGTMGPIEVAGSIAADLSGAKPNLAIDLATGALPLDRILAAGDTAAAPKATSGGAASSQAGGAGTSPPARADISDRWSRAPLDLNALDAFDGTIKIRADTIVLDNLRIENAAIDADLADAVLNLREAAGALYGGMVRANGRVAARGGLDVGLELAATKLDLAALARDMAKTERISGPLNVTASLTAKGQSQADLVSSLGGSGTLNGTLNVKTKAEEEVGSMVLDILGRKIKEIRNVAGAATRLFRSFAGTPATVAGTFAIEGGVVRTDDLRVDGRAARALTRGTADLAAWRIDTRTEVTETDGNSAAPLITVVLTGPLDRPNQRFGGTALQRAPAPAPVAPAPAAPAPAVGPQPSGTQSATPAPTPEPAQPLKPRDLIKKGLKDLLKGLSN